MARQSLLCIIGPTASGKSARAVEAALALSTGAEARGAGLSAYGGEIISVDSRQVYRGLDIGTEKITIEEMRGVPHHLIDIRDAADAYSAGDFVSDAARLIADIRARGKTPILAGGSHFYFDALLYGLPDAVPMDAALRETLEAMPSAELFERVCAADPRRAAGLDPNNRRRLVRALEIIAAAGTVSPRDRVIPDYEPAWIIMDVPPEEHRKRIGARLRRALDHGLVDEVRRARVALGDARLNELGLEYRIIGEFLRGERSEASLLPALSSKLWDYARRQKAWIRKLTGSSATGAAPN